MKDVEEAMEQIGERESAEWRVFGPPGTGKTTHCARQVARAARKYGPAAVLVTSFSKAAAQELVARDLPLPKEQVGTLHAHCFHTLGSPTIAESKAREWNEEFPDWAISGVRDNDLDDPYERDGGAKSGDDLLAAANRWRNRLMDFRDWPDRATREFYNTWLAWRRHHGLLDFTDILEFALRDCKVAPGDPRVLFCDEAQDCSALHLAIIRQWGKHADYLVTVGDDDQTIYDFTGATPDAFLNPPIPDDQKIVLSQSYRVPQAVFKLAMRWIGQVSRREPKEYRPRDERGAVELFDSGYYRSSSHRSPRAIIDAVEREVAAGRTVMCLVSCSYMLAAIRHELMERGLPFHNPYKLKRGDWNPLSITRGTSSAERILSFIKPHHTQDGQPWTADDYKKWAAWLVAAGTFQRGGKTGAKAMPEDAAVTLDQLKEWLEPDAYQSLMSGIMNETLASHMNWWLGRVDEEHKRVAAYPIRIIKRRGVPGLTQRPKIIIGTIHSVKGGEADTVFLFPDISRAADFNWTSGRAAYRDPIIRQFYVGMTRARQKLVLCPPSDFSMNHVTGLF